MIVRRAGCPSSNFRPNDHVMRLVRNRDDFEQCVRPELPVLLRVARRMTRCDDDANELVQKCLVKAFAAWKKFDGAFLRSWLIRILTREMQLDIRYAKSRPLEVPLEPESTGQEPFWREIEWKMMADRVLVALDELPDEFRLPVHLCDVEELSYDEIATALDIPLGTVRSRVHRGRRMIRRKLGVPEEENVATN